MRSPRLRRDESTKRERGAVLLLVFLIPTTVLFHPPTFPAEQMPFLKNLALMGGLFAVIGATGREGKG